MVSQEALNEPACRPARLVFFRFPMGNRRLVYAHERAKPCLREPHLFSYAANVEVVIHGRGQ